jgi:lipoprotein-releasing system ATP-binding protein
MADSILKLSHIEKVYGTRVKTQVLFDINLDFEPGSFNTIIGQSGSGKSTLMNIMGTLLSPTSGEVLIDGDPTTGLSPKELNAVRNELIGFVFQSHLLIPEFTALENVLMPYRISHPHVSKKARDSAMDLLDLVGIQKLADNKALDMSGGQQQRVAIARALMNRPKILLADEPTGNLDSDTTESVYDLFLDINQRFDTTFIIITHDRKIAEKAERLIELQDGKILSDYRNTPPRKESTP